MAFREKFSKTWWGEGFGVRGQLVDILLVGRWWGNRESTSSLTSWFQLVWGGVGSVISMWLTSPTWWGFKYLQNNSKDMDQNTIYSHWGGTKDPWLCLMATLLLFCLLDCFPLFLHFLISCIKFIIWNSGKAWGAKVFLWKRCRQRTWSGEEGWESVLGKAW